MHRPDGRAHRKHADARCARVEVASYPNAKYCRAAMRECMRMLRTIRMRNTFRATMRRCEREERTIGTRNFLRATARVGAASYPNTKVSSSDDAPVHVGAIALTRARTGGDRIAVWPDRATRDARGSVLQSVGRRVAPRGEPRRDLRLLRHRRHGA